MHAPTTVGNAALLVDTEKLNGRVDALFSICPQASNQMTKRDARTKGRLTFTELALATVSLDHKPKDSLLVSLADKNHNVRAILDDLVVQGRCPRPA